ncbi:hypothetical protein B0H10DRAFT_1091175 [Mycena sp. CBHHK59/15]|nr:hypothetical protein B0H10DRAFT_1091175 [Mycena sp. CBHHK59/15]
MNSESDQKFKHSLLSHRLSCSLSFPSSTSISPVRMQETSIEDSTLEHLAAEIHALESEKNALLLQLASVERSLGHAKAQYGIAKNRKALISSLPNEILARIFETGQDANTPGGVHFEVKCSHVCSLWRQITMNTPSLWSIIEVTPTKYADIIATYVARAKACTLDVRFHFDEVWVPDESLWDAILPAVEQWRCLTISTHDDATLYNTLAHLEPFRASLLEEITITRHGTSTIVSALGPLQGFRNAPIAFRQVPHC